MVGRDHRTKAMARSSVMPQAKYWGSGIWGGAYHPKSTHLVSEKVGWAGHPHTPGIGAPIGELLTPSYPKARENRPGRKPEASK